LKTIYVAHQLNAPTEQEREANRRAAARWSGWLSSTFRVATITQWIVLSSVWSEDEGRTLGLEIDKALIARCDGIFLCGPRVSEGMKLEERHASLECGLTCRDVTGFTLEQVDCSSVVRQLREWIDSLPEAA
jgi:hypothetical protein